MVAAVVLLLLTVYAAANLYVFHRLAILVPARRWWRLIVGIAAAVAVVAYPAAVVLERFWLSPVSTMLMWVGALWLGVLAYLLMQWLLIDSVHGCMAAGRRLRARPRPELSTRKRVRRAEAVLTVTVTFLLVIGGAVNAAFPCTRSIAVSLSEEEKVPSSRHLDIVVISDIHIGTLVSGRRLRRIVDGVNRLNADLVLMPGDIVDSDLTPVIARDLGRELAQLKARLGVYASTGNHEYIGGVEEAQDYLQRLGINLLRDERVFISEASIRLVGREDHAMARFIGRQRTPLSSIMGGVTSDGPLIILDHRPSDFAAAERAGADLLLCGHTHHGQLWPFHLITEMLFPQSRGRARRGGTHIYVSNGVGTWGPPMRIGTRPEIVHIRLTW